MTRKQQLLELIQAEPGLTTPEIVDRTGTDHYTRNLLTELSREIKIYQRQRRWYPRILCEDTQGIRFLRTLRTFGTNIDQKQFREGVSRRVSLEALKSLQVELDTLINFMSEPENVPKITRSEASYDGDFINWWLRDKS